MSGGRFTAAGQVAIAGYALSPLARHADTSLGALTVETCVRAIADADYRIGAEVEVVFEDIGDGAAVPHFRLATAQP